MKNIYGVTGSMKLIRDFTVAFITLCIYVVQLSWLLIEGATSLTWAWRTTLRVLQRTNFSWISCLLTIVQYK